MQTNRRENLTSTGLPLADTHYVVAKRKACFVFVYEVNDTVMMQMKVTDELGKEFSKGHTTVHKSAFPKSKDSWYSVIVDDSFTSADVEKMLDECFLQVKETLPKKV